MKIAVLQPILEVNDRAADEIRGELCARGIASVNLISAPGAGKTSLLERLLPLFAPFKRVGVLEGDIATSRDADRIAALGVPVVQLITGGGCHLEATFVARGLAELPLESLDLIVIENVGNIACPAEFDLGEAAKVAVLSVTEGDDKPAKYPLLFHEAAALVLNKIDLLPYTDFDTGALTEDFRRLNGSAPIFPLLPDGRRHRGVRGLAVASGARMTTRVRARVEGTVQGVGFRPAVYRWAVACGLAGFVRNDPAGVTMDVEGEDERIDLFFAGSAIAPLRLPALGG